jgi:hypothetical protein
MTTRYCTALEANFQEIFCSGSLENFQTRPDTCHYHRIVATAWTGVMLFESGGEDACHR